MAEKSPKHGLNRHARGGWYKSINGIWTQVVGKRDAPTAADADRVYEQRFAELWADAKRRPPGPVTDARLSDLFDQFIHAKRLAVSADQLEQRTFDEYVGTLQALSDLLGPLQFDELTAHDMTKVHQAWSQRYGVHRLSKLVAIVRGCFNWLVAQGFVPVAPQYGDFCQPTRSQFRRHEAKREEEGTVAMPFTPADFAALLGKADESQRAQILLALNGGFGNTDLSSLRARVVDLDKGWIDYRRGKTGVKRRCPLWPETIAAVREALPLCKITGNVFSTSDGRPLVQGTHDRLAARFKTLCESANCYLEGRGFYALRHAFATEAVRHASTLMVKRVTGHTSAEEDRVLDEHYVGSVDAKLCEMCDAVRHQVLSEWSLAQLATPLPGVPRAERKPRPPNTIQSSGAGTRTRAPSDGPAEAPSGEAA